jgi:DNA-binding beta-propeller fold protein YncE
MKKFHRAFRRMSTALLFSILVSQGHAAERLGDVYHNLFVTGRDSATVAVVNIDSETVIGRLQLDLVPRHLQISKSLGVLIGADGQSGRIEVVELAAARIQILPFDFVPSRLLIRPDGLALAVVDGKSGVIAMVDLVQLRETSRFTGPPGLRDLMFSEDGTTLFAVADKLRGVGVIDIATTRMVATLDAPPSVSLARSPNGREGFALATTPQAEITHLDLKTPSVIDRMSPEGADGLFLTGSGRYLILPQGRGGTLTVASTQPLRSLGTLKAGQGTGVVYSAWFDSVAFAPSPGKVMVYDLETVGAVAPIAIDGTPGSGAVSPDGAKLFLPIEESKLVAVIDARGRRLSSVIPVGFSPSSSIMAGGYGVCH